MLLSCSTVIATSLYSSAVARTPEFEKADSKVQRKSYVRVYVAHTVSSNLLRNHRVKFPQFRVSTSRVHDRLLGCLTHVVVLQRFYDGNEQSLSDCQFSLAV